jgi:hypothetical protein
VKERAPSIFRLHWPIKGICSLSFFSEECHACCVWRLKSISSVTKEDYSLATKLQIIGVLVGLIFLFCRCFGYLSF